MSRRVAAFLDEVVEFLGDEVLFDSYTDTRYFDECEVRVDYRDEVVKVKFLSHCAKDQSGELLRVDDVLDDAEVRLAFQFPGDQVTGSWTEGLSQCTVGLHVPDVPTPTVLKWEARDGGRGDLKADEWFDHDREYVARSVTARDAIGAAIEEHFEATIPSLQERTSTTPVPPAIVSVLYNDDHEIIDGIDPIDLE